VSFAANTLTLVGGSASDVVAVKAGTTFTDVTTNGRFLVRLQGTTSAMINTISFTGDGGTGDSLSVTGITTPLTVTLSNVEKLQLNSGDASVTSTTDAAGTLTLVTSTVAGTLSLDADGPVNQSGKLLVSGATTISAQDSGATTNFNITLATAGNSFGSLTLTGSSIQINEAGPTDLAATTATGALTVTSSGAITDSGTITVSGVTSLTSNGNSIIFDDGTSTFASTINAKGTNISIADHDTSGTALGAITATGSFTVTSDGGGISHSSGNVMVGGLATITATGGAISISSGTNNFGTLALTGTNITITEKSATDLTSVSASGTLSITSSGAITDSGEVNVDSNVTLTATGNNIILDSANNTLGSSTNQRVTFTGANVTITDDNGTTELGTSVAKGSFTLINTDTGSSGTGVSQASGATLNVTGRLTVQADSGTDRDINLNNTGNKFGSVSAFGAVVTLREADATDLFDTTASGNFTLTYGGAVTDSGTLKFQGSTTTITPISTSKSITLDTTDNAFTGSLVVTGTSASLVNTLASHLGATTLTAGYTLDSIGAVDQTDSTSISVTGVLSINAHSATITLGNGTGETASFGSISLTTTTDATLKEVGSSLLGNSTIGGNFSLTSTTGGVADSGTLVIGDKTSITAQGSSNNIILDSTGSTFGGSSGTDLELSGANVLVVDNDSATKIGTTSAAGTLTVTANGNITDTGTITVTGANKATFDATGDDITLDSSANAFGGAVSFFGDDASFTRTGAASLNLGTSTVQTLTLNNNGTISDSGTLKVNSGALIKAADDFTTPTTFFDVTLDSSANSFGSIAFTFAKDATLVEFGNTVLGASTVASLLVTSSGGISDIGTLTVGTGTTGNATLTANGGEIELDDSASTFAGTVALTGTNVSIDDNDATGTNLGVVNADGTFTLTSSGNVTQTGGISVANLASVSTTGSITLDETGGVTNNFDSLAFSGTDVSIKESSNTTLESSSASGTLTLVSTGNIEQVDTTVIVTSGSTTDLKAGTAGDHTILLNNAGDAFGSNVKLQGGNVTITDSSSGTVLADGTTVQNLTLNTTGAISQAASSTVIITGTLDATATTTIILDGTGNQFNRVAVNAVSASLTDSNDGTVLLTSVLTGTTATGNLSITNTSGNVTDDGQLTVPGTLTISATSGNIILDHVDSTFNIVVLAGVNVELQSYSSIVLGTATGDVTATGTLTIITFNNGDITQFNGVGDFQATVSSGGNAFFFADGVLTLDPTNTYGGTAQFFGDAGSTF